MSYHIDGAELETMGMPPSPYIRVNKTTDLTLSTSWQRIVYNGTSTRNTNQYPLVDSTNKLVQWDAVNNVFDFNNTETRHYDLIMNYHVNSSTLISLLNITMTTVRLRFVVPSPTPRYFPLPDDGGYIDLMNTGLANDYRGTYSYIVRAPADVQQYGIGLELSLAGGALGSIKLMTSDLSLYGR